MPALWWRLVRGLAPRARVDDAALRLARLILWSVPCVLALAGCALTEPVSGSPPRGAVALAPLPASYASWWADMERCAHRSRDMRELRWLTVPGASFEDGGARWVVLYTPDYALTIAGESVSDGAVVRYGMLAALTRARGTVDAEVLRVCGLTFTEAKP